MFVVKINYLEFRLWLEWTLFSSSPYVSANAKRWARTGKKCGKQLHRIAMYTHKQKGLGSPGLLQLKPPRIMKNTKKPIGQREKNGKSNRFSYIAKFVNFYGSLFFFHLILFSSVICSRTNDPSDVFMWMWPGMLPATEWKSRSYLFQWIVFFLSKR